MRLMFQSVGGVPRVIKHSAMWWIHIFLVQVPMPWHMEDEMCKPIFAHKVSQCINYVNFVSTLILVCTNKFHAPHITSVWSNCSVVCLSILTDPSFFWTVLFASVLFPPCFPFCCEFPGFRLTIWLRVMHIKYAGGYVAYETLVVGGYWIFVPCKTVVLEYGGFDGKKAGIAFQKQDTIKIVAGWMDTSDWARGQPNVWMAFSLCRFDRIGRHCEKHDSKTLASQQKRQKKKFAILKQLENRTRRRRRANIDLFKSTSCQRCIFFLIPIGVSLMIHLSWIASRKDCPPNPAWRL